MARPKGGQAVEKKVTLTVRIPESTLESLRARAENENRSLANTVATYLDLILPYGTSELKQQLTSNGRRKVRKAKR
jgi:gamma-glutamyl phosphate reductase